MHGSGLMKLRVHQPTVCSVQTYMVTEARKLTDICSGGTSVICFWRFLTAIVAAICQNFVNFENRNGREMKGSPAKFDFGDRVWGVGGCYNEALTVITALEGMLSMTLHNGVMSMTSNIATQMFPSVLYRPNNRPVSETVNNMTLILRPSIIRRIMADRGEPSTVRG